MSTAFFDLQAALHTRLSTMPSLPDVAWPNYGFEPTLGTLWIRPTVLPADTAAATYGDSGTDEQTGVYQIDVFAPLDEGDGEVRQMADTIADRFKPTTAITYNGLTVRCISVSIEGLTREENWLHLPVKIKYLAFSAKR
jgi:hypothetical protein